MYLTSFCQVLDMKKSSVQTLKHSKTVLVTFKLLVNCIFLRSNQCYTESFCFLMLVDNAILQCYYYVNRHSGPPSYHPHSCFCSGPHPLHLLGRQEGLRLHLHIPLPVHLPHRAAGVHHHPGSPGCLTTALSYTLSIDPFSPMSHAWHTV